MWKMMYKCHRVQHLISQQLNHVTDISIDLTTDSHRQATDQLETEVSFWYYSFCRLIKSQQEYLRTLCQWIQLTDCLVSNQQQSHCSSAVRRLCEEWHLGFEKLPDKVNFTMIFIQVLGIWCSSSSLVKLSPLCYHFELYLYCACRRHQRPLRVFCWLSNL